MKIYALLKERKPVIAALIGLFMGPLFGLAYVNRLVLGIAYTVFMISVDYLLEQEWFLENPNYELLSYALLAVSWFVYFGAVFQAHYLAKNKYPTEQKKKYTRFIPMIVLALFVFPFIALPIRVFVFAPFNIPSPSMEPNLKYLEHFVVKKYAYGYSRYSLPFNVKLWEGRIFPKMPERGELIVFDLPSKPEISYIKRVVGISGDKVQMIDGVLHINGAALRLDERGEYPLDGRVLYRKTEYISDDVSYDIVSLSDHEKFDNTDEIIVPDGHVFVLGDNRDFSHDSRAEEIGTIPLEYIVGRVMK